MAKVWQAAETSVKIATGITINTTTALSGAFGSGDAIDGSIKDLTIVEPEGAVEKVDLLGQDANNFQNADFDKKPFGVAEMSGTLVLRGDEHGSTNHTLEAAFYGTATAIATNTYSRYQAGVWGSSGRDTATAVLVSLTDGTDEVNLVLNNLHITKLGDKKISADGFWEFEFAGTCLPRDYYVEFKD